MQIPVREIAQAPPFSLSLTFENRSAVKKLQAILLLFILSVPFTGLISVFHYQKNLHIRQVKWKIIRGIDRKELVMIRIHVDESASKLHWKHSREFEFAGDMYDVVETVRRHDSVFFYCWPDQAETSLNLKLTKLIAGALGSDVPGKEQQKRLSDFFKIFFLAAYPGNYDYGAFFSAGFLFRAENQPIDSGLFPPPSPPPEIG